MHRCCRVLLPLVLVLALVPFLTPAAFADTYEVFNAGTTRGQLQATSLGLTTDGALIEQYGNAFYPQQSSCPNSQYCYVSISASGYSAATACTPTASGRCETGFTFDNGTPCTVPVSVGGVLRPTSGVCNNGFAIPEDTDLFLDANGTLIIGDPNGPRPGMPYAAEPGSLLVDKEGDFAFHYDQQDFFFVDLTSRADVTPEPSSFLLLGTGLGAAAVLLRQTTQRKRS